jgi:hypothetical protein
MSLHADLSLRVLHAQIALGSGIIRLIGPPCSGKTTAVTRLLGSLRFGKRRWDDENEISVPRGVYVSFDTCPDLKSLADRLLSELEDQSVHHNGNASVGEAMERLALRLAGQDPRAILHVFIDHINTPLATASPADVGDAAAQWYASARYSKHLAIWLVGTHDFAVRHASRPAFLPWSSVEQQLGSALRSTRSTETAGAFSQLASFLASNPVSRSSTLTSDVRHVVACTSHLLPNLNRVDQQLVADCSMGVIPGSVSKQIIKAFNSDAATGVASRAAETGQFDSTVSSKLVMLAVFFCAALTPPQASAVFGEGATLGSRRHRRENVVVKLGTPNTVTVSRICTVYDGLARMWAAQSGNPVEFLPPAESALHHLSALESQGRVKRAVHNSSAYKCQFGTEECRGVARELGIDLSSLLPS